MIKLVICLVWGLVVGVLVLQLRQQRLELNYQANRLHNQIDAQQAKLWNQQMQIGLYTAPNSIAGTVGHLDVKMVPQYIVPAGNTPAPPKPAPRRRR
jgi:cell division protein FtsL